MAAFLLAGCCLQGARGQCGSDWAVAQWPEKDWGNPSGTLNVSIHLATDERGNTFMAGYAFDSLYLQSTDGSVYLQDSGMDGKIQSVLSKYDREGVLQWVKGYTTPGGTSSYLALDVAARNDRVALCGIYSDSTSAPGRSYVTVLDSAGTEMWTLKFDGYGGMESYGLAFFPTGELAFTGAFRGEVEIPGGGLLSSATPSGWNKEVFVMKLDREGHVLWAVQSSLPSDPSQQEPFREHRGLPIEIDNNGNVVLGGHFKGILRMGDREINSGRFGGQTPFVAKLDGSTGEVLWLTGAETVENDYPLGTLYGLACDRSGNIYAVGYIQSEFEWGEWPLHPKGQYEVLVVCLEKAGSVKWARTFGSDDPEDQEWAASVMISPYQTLVVGVNLPPGTEMDGSLLPSFGDTDVAALEFSLSGHFLRGWVFGGPEEDYSYGGAMDAEGNLLFCGNSRDKISFGSVGLEFEEDAVYTSFLYKRCMSLPAPASSGEEVRLFPNPGKGVFWLEGDFGDGRLEVTVANTLGQELARQTIQLFDRKAVYGINTGGLAPGFYYLVLSRGGEYLRSIPVCIIP